MSGGNFVFCLLINERSGIYHKPFDIFDCSCHNIQLWVNKDRGNLDCRQTMSRAVKGSKTGHKYSIKRMHRQGTVGTLSLYSLLFFKYFDRHKGEAAVWWDVLIWVLFLFHLFISLCVSRSLTLGCPMIEPAVASVRTANPISGKKVKPFLGKGHIIQLSFYLSCLPTPFKYTSNPPLKKEKKKHRHTEELLLLLTL